MRRIVWSSLLVTEITVFLLVLLLFLLNTSHPLLLLVPLIGVLGGCLGFPALLRRFEHRRSELGQELYSNPSSRAKKALSVALPSLFLSFIVAAIVIGWLIIR